MCNLWILYTVCLCFCLRKTYVIFGLLKLFVYVFVSEKHFTDLHQVFTLVDLGLTYN